MTLKFTTPTSVKLTHVNLRTERHGDEDTAAIDLKFTRTAGNADTLDPLSPDLMTALYTRTADTDAQQEIEGVPKAFPNLRFPKIGPLSWDAEVTGARLEIQYGARDDGNLIFGACKVNKITLDCAEGGSVTTTFRVQTSDIPDGALDKLSKQLQGEVQIVLLGPDDFEQTPSQPALKTIEGGKGKAKQADKPAETPAPAKDATDIFLEQQGA